MDHRGKLLLLGAVGIALMAVYALAGVGFHWDYVLARRVLKLAAVVVTAVVIACSTVIFQTITANRILTPSIIGIDSLYVLLQTALVVFFRATSAAWVHAGVLFSLSAGLLIVFAVLLYRPLRRRVSPTPHFVLPVGPVLRVCFHSPASYSPVLIDPNEFRVL